MGGAIFQSRNILECARLQLYHRYPGHLYTYHFQCLCLYFPLVNNCRITGAGRDLWTLSGLTLLLTWGSTRAAHPGPCPRWLWILQGWKCHCFSGQPVLVPDCPWSKSSCFECWSEISCMLGCSHCFSPCQLLPAEKSLSLSSLCLPIRYLCTLIRSLLNHLSLRPKNPSLPLLICQMLQSLNHQNT